jgi:hypothetical protein
VFSLKFLYIDHRTAHTTHSYQELVDLRQAITNEPIENMVRTPYCDKNGLRKGTWTPEEDKKLIAYVTRYGCWNWRQLPKFAGIKNYYN